jgi:hypothetical protein
MFLPTIHVRLSREEAVFTSKERSKTYVTRLYFSLENPHQIVSIGDPPGTPCSPACPLFDGETLEKEKGLCLEAFLRVGFHAMVNAVYQRPVVEFEVTPDLVSHFGGYHRYILHQAAKRAGAVRTSYEKWFK